ncbi:hypothetical protein Lal_00018646, partial [Lupinus albus]
DEDEIELCGDDEEDDDVEIGSSELHGSTNLRNENDLFIRMQFESKEAIVNAIKQFHICNPFDYIIVESMPNRYVGRCKHFEINKINGTHTCVSTIVSQDHTKINSSFISNGIINLVYEDPGILIKVLMKEIVSHFGYTVTYRNVWIVKQLAMSRIYGD